MTTLAHNSTVRVSCFDSRDADAWETHQAMMRLEVLLDAKQCDCCAADLPYDETGLCEDCCRNNQVREGAKVVEPHTEKNAIVYEVIDRLDW